MADRGASTTAHLGAPAPETLSGPLRRDRRYVRFWISRAVSQLGSAVSLVALPVLVYERSASPVLVALVAAAGTLPYVVFGLFAGALADRLDRKRVMVVADGLSALVLASIPVLAVAGALTPALIIAAAMASSSLSIFFDAGSYGLVPQLAGPARLASANSGIYSAETTARIAGTAIAGGLIGVIGAQNTTIVDSGSFLISAALVATLGNTKAAAQPARQSLWSSVGEGLCFLWSQADLRVMTAVGLLLSLTGGGIIGQLVVYANRQLHLSASDARTGLLYTAWSLGGFLGSLVLPLLLRRLAELRVLLLLLPIITAITVGIAFISLWPFAMPALLVFGIGYIALLVNTMTYSQHITPPYMQGRVNTTRRMLSSGLGVPLGAFVGGVLTARLGIHVGLLLSVGTSATATLIMWSVHLRRQWSRRTGQLV